MSNKRICTVILCMAAMLPAIYGRTADLKSGDLYYNVDIDTKKAEVTAVDDGAPAYSGVVIIPESVSYEGINCTVASIAKNAFKRSNITDVQIPATVTAIGDSAFYFCENLANVTLPPYITTVSRSSFAGCPITAIVLPEGVTLLGNGAFQSCTALHTAMLPSTLKTIDAYGFNNCHSLVEIYCAAVTPPKATGWAIFIDLTGIDVVVPDASVDAYSSTAPWNDTETFTIYPSEPVEVNVSVSGVNRGDYEEITLGENIAYRIYDDTDRLVAITAAERYFLPVDGTKKTYRIVPTNCFSDGEPVYYTVGDAGVDEASADAGSVRIFATGGVVRVEAVGDIQGEWVYVYDSFGRLRYQQRAESGEIRDLPRGQVYIVRCGSVVRKVIL
ncbi:MAG: leucine-rich repeat domain-containing protein [Muribaculaceae bacterium]